MRSAIRLTSSSHVAVAAAATSSTTHRFARRFNATEQNNSAATATPAAEEETAAAAAAPKKKRFSAAITFKIAPENVDSDNCPSAKEIKEMLPTVDELYDQLPTTSEVRKMYDLDRPGAGRAPPTPEIYASQGVMASLKRTVMGAMSADSDLNKGPHTNPDGTPAAQQQKKTGLEGFFDRFSLHPESTQDGPHAMSKLNVNGHVGTVNPDGTISEPATSGSNTGKNGKNNKNGASADEGETLWLDCDTPEDIINEERFGGEGEEAPKPTGEHVALAWKALMYGTVLATLMTVLSGFVMAWYMGFSSYEQIREHMSTRKQREIEKLKADAVRMRKEQREKELQEGLLVGKYIDHHDEKEDEEVHVYEIDLTQPATLMEQMNGLMQLVEDLANQEAEKEKAREEAEKRAIIAKMQGGSTNSVAAPASTTSSSSGFVEVPMKSAAASEEEAASATPNPFKTAKRSYSL